MSNKLKIWFIFLNHIENKKKFNICLYVVLEIQILIKSNFLIDVPETYVNIII